jgi:fructokinase
VIVAAGEALVDLLIQPDGRLRSVPGGGPFNVSRTIARLGGEVAFLGRLSADRFGAILRAALADDGVDLTMTEATEAPTTLAIAELDGIGGATYRFHTAETAAPELSSNAVLAAFAGHPRAFHLGTLGLVLEPMATALEAGLATVGAGTLVMLDPNCRPAVIRDRAAYLDRIHRVMARTDVVKVSTDDLAYLAPGEPATVATQAVLDRGPSVVLVTDGPRHVAVVTRRGTQRLPIPPVEVVDTVGAGDAFGGAFLARWIELGRGRPDLADHAAVTDAVGFAIEVARLTCERAGADPPRRAEVDTQPGYATG